MSLKVNELYRESDIEAPYLADWNFCQYLYAIPWPSVAICGKFDRDCPRVTLPSRGLNARCVAVHKMAILDLSEAISQKRCKIRDKLVLITNRKSYMSFRLVRKLVTLNDLERRNGPFCFFTEFIYSIAIFRSALRKSGWRCCCKNFTFAISSPDEFLSMLPAPLLRIGLIWHLLFILCKDAAKSPVIS